MPLYWVFAGFALLAFAIQLWQFLAAHRFPLHQRTPNPDFHPRLSILKPLKGTDQHTRACLASWLTQNYPAPVQILFGVQDATDPVFETVRELRVCHPNVDARLIVCPDRLGSNAKVATLAQLEAHALHDVILISDADVMIPPDFLAQAVLPLRNPAIALVNCFYRLANPVTAALRWEAVAVNVDFWSQVLQSRMLKPLDFALGAVVITRRADLKGIGGFRSLADHLADDYQLGHRVHQLGGQIELMTIPVECWDAPAGWAAVWGHQLRWSRTIRVCQPGPFFASILGNGSVWSIGWMVAALGMERSVWPAAALLAVRAAFAESLYRTMCSDRPGHAAPWMVWLKDALSLALWAAAFMGNTITWRGARFRVQRDGRLVPQ